jgi:hypothetical protein
VVDAQRELLRADEALCAQVNESREFERQSAENRGKKLKGGGTTLLEEERFRKNSKAKFNKLSERILLHLGKLNTLTGKAEGSQGIGLRAAHIDVRPDLSALSEQGKDLARGRFKDKVELMHLQLSTGTSGSSAAFSIAATGSNIPVPHAPAGKSLRPVTAPPAAPGAGTEASAASALAGSGAGGLGLSLGLGVKAKTSYGSAPGEVRRSNSGHTTHNTPQNVFGFATAPSADAFDANTRSSSISSLGEASPDAFAAEGATEKENMQNQLQGGQVRSDRRGSDTDKPAATSAQSGSQAATQSS